MREAFYDWFQQCDDGSMELWDHYYSWYITYLYFFKLIDGINNPDEPV